MRRQEEGLLASNYLDPDINLDFKKFIDGLDDFFNQEPKKRQESLKSKVLNHFLSKADRAYAVQKIFDLHRKKGYRIETVFTAVNIMDRYLMYTGHWEFPREHTCLLATASLLLAAKMEEKLAPNFEAMIMLLDQKEQLDVTKKKLAVMESEILVALGFDLIFPGPVVSIERYLHILKVDGIPIIREMADQICKFVLNDPHFLSYRPSHLAACAAILSINIFHRDKEQHERQTAEKFGEDKPSDVESFFSLSKKGGKR